jgi:hypothetical protein
VIALALVALFLAELAGAAGYAVFIALRLLHQV